MAFKNYEGAGQLYLNGQLLAEISSCTYSFDANRNDVNTMQLGFAGQSDGASQVRITFDSAIPKAGHESDYHDAIEQGEIVRFVFIDGDKRRTCEGKLQSYSSTRDVGSAASSSIEFRGVRVGSST